MFFLLKTVILQEKKTSSSSVAALNDDDNDGDNEIVRQLREFMLSTSSKLIAKRNENYCWNFYFLDKIKIKTKRKEMKKHILQ